MTMDTAKVLLTTLIVPASLAVFGCWADGRLSTMQSASVTRHQEEQAALQAQLESLKWTLAEQGSLAERKVAAYEAVWVAASEFFRRDESLDEGRVARGDFRSLCGLYETWESTVWRKFIFLDDATRKDFGDLLEGFRPALDKQGSLRTVSFELLSQRTELAHLIYQRMLADISIAGPSSLQGK